MPGGHARNLGFNLHGHLWQEQPWINGSTEIGINPGSEYKGISWGHGPTHHQTIWTPSAGGYFKITGDYLWRDQTSFHFDAGIWGIFRVVPAGTLPPPPAAP